MILIYSMSKDTNGCLIKLVNNCDKVSYEWLAD